MEDIADHVISRGYRRPIFVAGPQTHTAHLIRKDAVLKRWQAVKVEQPAFTVVAVTGFDDVPVAANPNYRLTTYRQPITAMAEALVGILKGESGLTLLSHFVGQLVIRESA